MKRVLAVSACILYSLLCVSQSISTKERQKSLGLLLESQRKLKELTAGLSEEQLNYKPGPDRWSIMDNVDHLVSAERLVLNIIKRSLETSGENQQSDFTDDDFVKLLSTRAEKKFNAPEKLRPKDDRYQSFHEVMLAHDSVRTRSIAFIKRTDENLRAHFSKSPIGNLDTFQWTLQISAHTLRHIEQIEEIIANPNFPKK